MKKILISLLAILLLAGCSSKTEANITDKDTVIWKSADEAYTSNDLYKAMKGQDITTLVVNKIVNTIAEKEGISLDDTKAEIEATYESFVEMGYGEYLEYYYGTKENYVEQALSEGMSTKLMEKVATDKYEEYVIEYTPYKAEIAYFDSQETAKAIKEAVDAKENTFAYAASLNGYTSEISTTIYTDDSDLPVEVKEVAASMSSSGLSNIITTSVTATDADGNSTVTSRYYLINMVETNPDNFKDEFVSYIQSNYLNETDVINELIKKYEVKVHDQDIYDALVETYDGIGY